MVNKTAKEAMTKCEAKGEKEQGEDFARRYTNSFRSVSNIHLDQMLTDDSYNTLPSLPKNVDMSLLPAILKKAISTPRKRNI